MGDDKGVNVKGSAPHLPASAAFLALLAGLAEGQLPAGFAKVQVAPKAVFTNGTSIAHGNDGRVFVAEIAGAVKLVKGDTAITVHKVSTNTDREQGLLKILAHPAFDRNGWLYLYYLTADRDHHNIDRIALDQAGRVTENKTVVRLPQLTNAGRHNGSGMAFGKDGYLYVGRGEDETASWAPQWTTQRGKVLRFTEEGAPAPGNPHAATPGAGDEERSVWARGFRNPFTLASDPVTGKVYVGDVGAGHEEINDVSSPDAAKDWNYSWGAGDGVNPGGKGATIDPAWYYRTGSIGCAVVSEVPYNAALPSNWPAEYRNRLYLNDWCQGWIRSVPLSPASPLDVASASGGAQIFGSSGFSNALGLSLGRDGALWYAAYNNRAVYRIVYGTTGLVPSQSASPALLVRAAASPGGMSITLSPASDAFRAGDAVELEIRGPDGRLVHAARVAADGPAVTMTGFRPARAGIHAVRATWSVGGALRRSTGRLAVLP